MPTRSPSGASSTSTSGSTRARRSGASDRKMRRTDVTVQVREADGTLATRTKAFYDSEYGPMLTSLQGLPLFPWSTTTAYSLFDANAESLGRIVNFYLGLNQGSSVRRLDELLRRTQGPPFNTTEAADVHGDALFADIGSVPNIDVDRYESCNT